MKAAFYKIGTLVFLLFFLGIGTTFSQQKKIIKIDSSFKYLDPINKIDLYYTKSLISGDEFLKLQNQHQVKKTEEKTFFPGMGDKFYWLMFHLKNVDSKPQQIFIEVSNPQIDSIYFYQQLNDSAAVMLSQNGDEIPFYKRSTPNEMPVFKVSFLPDEEKSLLLMLRKRRNNKFPIYILGEHQFEERTRKRAMYYGLYFGGVLVTFLASVLIGTFIKSRIMLSYSVYILSVSLFVFSDSGYGFELVYPNSSGFSSLLRVPLSIFISLSFLSFSIQFLELKKIKPKWVENLKIFAVFWVINYLFCLPFWWIRNSACHWYILYFNYVCIAIVFISMVVISILIFKYIQGKALTYLFAILMLVFGILVFYATQFGITKSSIVSLHPFMFASISELSVFSIALFFQILKINNQRNTLLLEAERKDKEVLEAQIKGNELASKRISEDLHDNIAGRLALIKNKLLSNNQTRKQISEEVKQVYNEVRDISHRLSSNDFMMFGFKTAVESFIEELNLANNSHIFVSLEFNIAENLLKKEIGFQIYRILQEALLNCVKHAGEAQVNVIFTQSSNNIILQIEDNGNGFNLHENEPHSGNGIANMHMRAKSIDTHFSITSQPEEGTKIRLEVPIKKWH